MCAERQKAERRQNKPRGDVSACEERELMPKGHTAAACGKTNNGGVARSLLEWKLTRSSGNGAEDPEKINERVERGGERKRRR